MGILNVEQLVKKAVEAELKAIVEREVDIICGRVRDELIEKTSSILMRVKSHCSGIDMTRHWDIVFREVKSPE